MKTKPTQNHKILRIVIYLCVASAISFFVIGRYNPGLKIGSFAPINDKILGLSGRSNSFKNLSAQKPMLVNFWATWCPPCQKELPILSKMAAKYKKQISFVGAIVDSNKEDVLALKDRFSLNYQLGFVDSAVMNNWRAETLPTTYIINPSGIVVWAKNGILDQEILEAALKKALDSQ